MDLVQCVCIHVFACEYVYMANTTKSWKAWNSNTLKSDHVQNATSQKWSANTSIFNCFAPFRQAVYSRQAHGYPVTDGEHRDTAAAHPFWHESDPDHSSFWCCMTPNSPLGAKQALLGKKIPPHSRGTKTVQWWTPSTAVSWNVCISFWKTCLCCRYICL